MRRLFLLVTAAFLFGCLIDKDTAQTKTIRVEKSHEIVCKHPDGRVLKYKRKGDIDWGNTPFRSRNAIWEFEGERDDKLYSVWSTFCHIEKEIKAK